MSTYYEWSTAFDYDMGPMIKAERNAEGVYVITEVTRWGTKQPMHTPPRGTMTQETARAATHRFFHQNMPS